MDATERGNMNIYRLSQKVNTGYDSFDSCIVLAETSEAAKRIHPRTRDEYGNDIVYDEEKKGFYDGDYQISDAYSSWTNDLDAINVELIGLASPRFKTARAICASFNAG